MKKLVIFDAVKYIWPVTITSVISNTAIGYLEIYLAGIIGKFTDAVLHGNRLTASGDIMNIIIAVCISVVAIPIFDYLSDRVMLKQSLKHDICIMSRFLDKDFKNAMIFDQGDITYRIEDDPNYLRFKVIRIPYSIITAVLMSLILYKTLSRINILYTSVCIAAALIPVIAEALISPINAKYEFKKKEYEGNNRNLEMDICNNFNYIKLFSISNIILNGISKLFKFHYDNTVVKSVNIKSLSDFINSLFDFAADITVIGFGCYLLSKGKITPGTIAAMFGYMASIKTIVTHLRTFIKESSEFPQCVDRVVQLYEHPENPGKLKTGKPENITAKSIKYCFEESKPVLNNISFNFNMGQKLAVIGANGTGKSTLLNILTGLYSDYSGNIKINNHELKDISKNEWGNRIAFAEQQPYIFNTTVKENVHMGNLNVDNDKLDKIINIAELDELKDKMAGTDGNNLSGGERQRISIARALLKDADILILDEPLNNLDEQGRKLIHMILSKKGKSIIYISHDNELLKYADNILKL